MTSGVLTRRDRWRSCTRPSPSIGLVVLAICWSRRAGVAAAVQSRPAANVTAGCVDRFDAARTTSRTRRRRGRGQLHRRVPTLVQGGHGRRGVRRRPGRALRPRAVRRAGADARRRAGRRAGRHGADRVAVRVRRRRICRCSSISAALDVLTGVSQRDVVDGRRRPRRGSAPARSSSSPAGLVDRRRAGRRRRPSLLMAGGASSADAGRDSQRRRAGRRQHRVAGADRARRAPSGSSTWRSS